jgi:molybdenum cofactor cytidylyltransferase
MSVAAIVLAAGRSTRMGANKMLADVAGEPLIRRTVRAVAASQARPLIVVTGHESDKVAAALAGLDATIVHNPRYEEGLATSLQSGIGVLPWAADGALVCLGDMPLVTAPIIDALIARFAREPHPGAVVPAHAGEWGNPVLLSRVLFSEIAMLTGDAGARRLLRGRSDVAVIEADDAVRLDVDTQEELRALRRVHDAKP